MDHDTTPAVMTAAIDPRRMATTGNLDDKRSLLISLIIALSSNVFEVTASGQTRPLGPEQPIVSLEGYRCGPSNLPDPTFFLDVGVKGRQRSKALLNASPKTSNQSAEV